MEPDIKTTNLVDIAKLGYDEVFKSFRQEIFKKYRKEKGKVLIGIFGYYEVQYPDGKNGEEVIDFLSKEFAKRNYFVINGKCIIYESKGKIVSKSNVQSLI